VLNALYAKCAQIGINPPNPVFKTFLDQQNITDISHAFTTLRNTYTPNGTLKTPEELCGEQNFQGMIIAIA
jgi:hypothetical protein